MKIAPPSCRCWATSRPARRSKPSKIAKRSTWKRCSILRNGVYVLRVRGESMIEDHLCDGDYVVIERRENARNGEQVVALLDSGEATLKRFYKEGRKDPPSAGQQDDGAAHRRGRPRKDPGRRDRRPASYN